MKEHSIYFTADEIRAILDGRKTQFRVEVKPQPDARGLRTTNVQFEDYHGREVRPPYYFGDLLFVKEAFTWDWKDYPERTERFCVYKADNPEYPMNSGEGWRSPVTMPRWASRITLKVVSVRVERLKDISEADAIAEGVIDLGPDPMNPLASLYSVNNQVFYSAASAFASLCLSTRPDSWKENRWVWAYTFKVVS